MKLKKILFIMTASVCIFLAGVFLSGGSLSAGQAYHQLKVLLDVFNIVSEEYVDETNPQKLIYGAARGVVSSLDPFSQFMEPKQHKELEDTTQGEFGGLGIRIIEKDDYITIVTPLPGTPAYKAGIMPGDLIVEIDGKTTKGISADDAMDKMRGKPGAKIEIKIKRKEGEKTIDKTFNLKRETIKPMMTSEKMLEDKIGYLRIDDFSGHITEDAFKSLKELEKEGARALILDLRYNLGGLLNAAVDLAKMFIGGNKMIVYTKGRKPENYQEFRSGANAPFESMPIVLLVNGGSASGSEIVAGALQDNNRAVLVGDKTFGKASVQSLIPLSDGSGLRLTVARYYTPSGKSIQRNFETGAGGIEPDVKVKISRDDAAKIFRQFDTIYPPGAKPYPAVSAEDAIADKALEKAVEILKAREKYDSLKNKEVKEKNGK